MTKTFKSVELSTEYEQEIRIMPSPERDCILLEFKEVHEKYSNKALYLDFEILNEIVKEFHNLKPYLKTNETEGNTRGTSS